MRRLVRTALIGAVLLIALFLVARPGAGALLAPGGWVGHHQLLPGRHTCSRLNMVLPVDGSRVIPVGSDLLAAVDWMCSSGKLTRRFKARNFEPFDSRKG